MVLSCMVEMEVINSFNRHKSEAKWKLHFSLSKNDNCHSEWVVQIMFKCKTESAPLIGQKTPIEERNKQILISQNSYRGLNKKDHQQTTSDWYFHVLWMKKNYGLMYNELYLFAKWCRRLKDYNIRTYF